MIGIIAGDIIASPYRKNPLKDSFSIFFPLFSASDRIVVDSQRKSARTVTYDASQGVMSGLAKAAADWYLNTGRTYDEWVEMREGRTIHPSHIELLAVCGPIVELSASAEEARACVDTIFGDHLADARSLAGVFTDALLAVKNGGDRERLRKVFSAAGFDVSRNSSEIRPFADGFVAVDGNGRTVMGDGKVNRSPGVVIPAVFAAFNESSSYEECVRRAVAMGGDPSVTAALAGSLAEFRWGVPELIHDRAADYLTADERALLNRSDRVASLRMQGVSLDRDGGGRIQSDINGTVFSVIRMEGYFPVYVIPEDHPEILDAVKAVNEKLGSYYEVIRPSDLDAKLASLSAQVGYDGRPLSGVYLEHPRPEVKTLWYQSGLVRSATTRRGTGTNDAPIPSLEERQKTYNEFQELKKHVNGVRSTLEERAGFSHIELFTEMVAVEFGRKVMEYGRYSSSVSLLDSVRKVRNFLSDAKADIAGVSARVEAAGRLDSLLDEINGFPGRLAGLLEPLSGFAGTLDESIVGGAEMNLDWAKGISSSLDAFISGNAFLTDKARKEFRESQAVIALKAFLNDADKVLAKLNSIELNVGRVDAGSLRNTIESGFAKFVSLVSGSVDVRGFASRLKGVVPDAGWPDRVSALFETYLSGRLQYATAQGLVQDVSRIQDSIRKVSAGSLEERAEAVDRLFGSLKGEFAKCRPDIGRLAGEFSAGKDMHLHFKSAFYPVALDHSIELYQGDILRGRVMIDDAGRFQVDTSAFTGYQAGEYLEGAMNTMNVFMQSRSGRGLENMKDVRLVINAYCLDDGRILDEDERKAVKENDDEAESVRMKYRTNVDRAVEDLGSGIGIAKPAETPEAYARYLELREQRRSESEQRYEGRAYSDIINAEKYKGCLFTIGHSNLPREEFQRLLKDYGIEVLIDARSYNYSTFNPQFNGKPLSESLDEAGIEYHHVPALGGRQTEVVLGTDGRPMKGDDGKDVTRVLSYGEVFARPEFAEKIAVIRDGVAEGLRVAVMDSFSDPLDSHRMLMIGRALEHPEVYGHPELEPVPVQHITRKGTVLSQEFLENKLVRMYSGAEQQPLPGLDGRDLAVPAQQSSGRIESFSGEYRFLSNFYPCKVHYAGLEFPSVENAYQAAKCVNKEDMGRFVHVTASEAKKLGRSVDIRPDWDDVKVGVMKALVTEKFHSSESLLGKLNATGGIALVEGNTWGDTFWGVDQKTGQGRNVLGGILMDVRRTLSERKGVSADSLSLKGDRTTLDAAFLRREQDVRAKTRDTRGIRMKR